jgi:O-antigen biosynthesis protein
MEMKPFVSIIIVNYNGKHLLQECLSSVFAISYPQFSFEVIVVDNNSTDDSVPYIRKHFKQVILIESKKNLGFTGGNRLGLSQATGEYIVLLNSDTKVEKDWLQGLVRAAKPKDVGMVNSKLYFATPFLSVRITSSTAMRSEVYGGADFSPVGILLEDILCEGEHLDPLVWYESGFYEKMKGGIQCRWTKGESIVLLPFSLNTNKNTYTVTVHGYPPGCNLTSSFSFMLGKEVLLQDEITPNEVQQYTITIPKERAAKHFVWLIQNAGNVVLTNGYGKDRGSLLYKGKDQMKEFYEHDSQVFANPSSLLACCGASCLIKREVIEQVGFLDDDYYMYYEDLDFSLRIWRAGWNIVYEPSSIVYHKHKSTVVNTGNFSFLYHVEKNHMAFTFIHFPFSTILTQWIGLCLRFIVATVFTFLYLFSENISAYEGWRQIYESRKKAIIFIVKHFQTLLHKRQNLHKQSTRSFQEMLPLLY